MLRAALAKESVSKGTGAYICLDVPIAGLKPGIYHVDYCVLVGEQAFFSRSVPVRKLIAVPRSVAFVTRAEAQAYAGSKGRLCWCVKEDDGGFEVFEAFVRENVRENLYGSYRRTSIVVRREGDQTPISVYRLQTFSTRLAAERHAVKLVERKLAVSRESLAEYKKEVRDLGVQLAKLKKRRRRT